MTNINWDHSAKLGQLQAVVDPSDQLGYKNRLIDCIHWNALRKILTFNHSKQLLDFGCGTGRFATRIKSLGIDYTGIDSSPVMIETARSLHRSPPIHFVYFDGFKIPFSDKSFDTCISCGVFQYLIYQPGVQEILTEIRRILVPGGHLIMIEQASLSNQASGTVARASTESDYLAEVSKLFRIEAVRRVRSCRLSTVTSIFHRVSRNFPWLLGLLMNRFAERELRKALNASDTYFVRIEYYDMMIVAIVP